MPVLPEFSLAGKVAVLSTTGGDEAPFLAQCLAEAGAAVFVIGRTPYGLEQALNGLDSVANGAEHGVKSRGVAVSLANPDGVRQAMAAFDSDFSRVDILVNDARSMLARPMTEISPDEWDEVHSRNAKATFLLCQAVGGRMVQQGYGRIVNVVSELARTGNDQRVRFRRKPGGPAFPDPVNGRGMGQVQHKGERPGHRLVFDGRPSVGRATAGIVGQVHAPPP